MKKVLHFILWVIASTVGLGIGILLILSAEAISGIKETDLLPGHPYCCWDLFCCGAITSSNWSFKIIPMLKLFLFTGLLTGAVGFSISFFQWLILRKKGISAIGWLFWSTASYLAPCFLMLLYQYRLIWNHGFIQWGANASPLDYAIFYIVAVGYFIVSGIFQWVAVRKCMRFS